MGLFDKLFGSARPAPQCEIHENDRNLVRPDDIAWWNSLSFDDCVALEQQDSAFKLAAYIKYVEKDGLDKADAAKRVRLGFLYFYTQVSGRSEPKFTLPDDDAPLPYPLKERINRALMSGQISRADFSQASSANALIRERIRSGRI